MLKPTHDSHDFWRGKLCVMVFAILSFFTPFLFAQEFWYQAYDSAMKAIGKKDWTRAEAKLKIALSQEPKKHGKGIDTYGFGNRIDYFPDYYLGVVYFNQGKYKEALGQFEKAEKLNVSTEDGALYENLLKYKQATFRISIIFARRAQKPFQESTSVEFGCEERKSATVSFQLPPGARLIQAYLAWKKISNADSSSITNPVVLGNIVVATGEVGGLSRILCTGGGHAELELTGVFAIDSIVNSNPKIVYTSLGKGTTIEELTSYSDISRLLIEVNSSSKPKNVSKIEVPVSSPPNMAQTIQKVSVDQRYLATLKGNILTIGLAQH